MTIKYILRDRCESCGLRIAEGCPAIESCAVDVLRPDSEGIPYISYPGDCHNCFLCREDCPLEAIKVSADVPFPPF